MAQRALDNDKIDIVWNHVVEEVLGDETNGVTGVRVRSTKDNSKRDLQASGMFLAIGHTPNTDFLQGSLALTDTAYVKLTTPLLSL